jgi:hypothetical protein
MQKILVYSLILTFIFPAYCFANPQRALPTEQEIVEGLLLIIEDGKVEEGEITAFLDSLEFGDNLSWLPWVAAYASVITVMVKLITLIHQTFDLLPALNLDFIVLYYGGLALKIIYLFSIEIG